MFVFFLDKDRVDALISPKTHSKVSFIDHSGFGHYLMLMQSLRNRGLCRNRSAVSETHTHLVVPLRMHVCCSHAAKPAGNKAHNEEC